MCTKNIGTIKIIERMRGVRSNERTRNVSEARTCFWRKREASFIGKLETINLKQLGGELAWIFLLQLRVDEVYENT